MFWEAQVEVLAGLRRFRFCWDRTTLFCQLSLFSAVSVFLSEMSFAISSLTFNHTLYFCLTSYLPSSLLCLPHPLLLHLSPQVQPVVSRSSLATVPCGVSREEEAGRSHSTKKGAFHEIFNLSESERPLGGKECYCTLFSFFLFFLTINEFAFFFFLLLFY